MKLASYAGYLPTQRQVKETQQIGSTSRSTAKNAQSTVLVQAELEKHYKYIEAHAAQTTSKSNPFEEGESLLQLNPV